MEPEFAHKRYSFLLRLLIADLVGSEARLARPGGAARDIADLQRRLDGREARAEEFPHPRDDLLLVHGFPRRLLRLHLDWLDEVEAPPMARNRNDHEFSFSSR